MSDFHRDVSYDHERPVPVRRALTQEIGERNDLGTSARIECTYPTLKRVREEDFARASIEGDRHIAGAGQREASQGQDRRRQGRDL